MKSKILSFILFVSLSGSFAQAAILPPGSLDTTFGTDKSGTVRTVQEGLNVATASALQPDGKIIVAGSQGPEGDKNFLLARYLPNGTLDTTFGNQGIVISDMSGHALNQNPNHNDEINAIVLDGEKILVAGYVTHKLGGKNPILARFNADGSLDATFANQGINIDIGEADDEIATAIAIQPNQKIMMVARVVLDPTDEDILIIQYDPDGTNPQLPTNGNIALDLNLKGDGNLLDIPHAMQIQSDGKIVVAGSVSGVPLLLRLNADLSFDDTFGPSDNMDPTTKGLVFFPAFLGDIRSLILQPDGKIVAGGFIGENDTKDFALFRWVDGNASAPDSAFGNGGAAFTNFSTDSQGTNSKDELYNIALQSDGKIVGAGISYSSTGIDFALARYNSDGNLDTSFGKEGKVITAFKDNETTVVSGVSGVLIQADGKIIAVGQASQSIGTKAQFALARYFSQPTEVRDETIPQNNKSGGGCSLNTFGTFNLWAILFGLIPIGFLAWRKSRIVQ